MARGNLRGVCIPCHKRRTNERTGRPAPALRMFNHNVDGTVLLGAYAPSTHVNPLSPAVACDLDCLSGHICLKHGASDPK